MPSSIDVEAGVSSRRHRPDAYAHTVAVLRSVDLRNSDSSIDSRLAEAFLTGEPCADPVPAHKAVMAIYAAGSNRYPTLWEEASRYASSQEAVTLEKLAGL